MHGHRREPAGSHNLAAGRIAHRFINPQLVQPCATFKVKIVKKIKDDIAGRRHEIHVPGHAVAVHGHGAAAIGKERSSQPDVLHVLEGRAGDVGIRLGVARSIVQQTHAGADQFDVAEFLRSYVGYQTVKGPELGLAAEIEALKHVVPER